MNRVVAITGASAGIGRATAIRLARDGAAVVVCARRAGKLDAVAAEVTAAGGQALAVAADVTRVEDMEAFVARTVERFGRLDVMMCNAGFGIAGALDDITPGQMRKLMDVNWPVVSLQSVVISRGSQSPAVDDSTGAANSIDDYGC